MCARGLEVGFGTSAGFGVVVGLDACVGLSVCAGFDVDVGFAVDSDVSSVAVSGRSACKPEPPLPSRSIDQLKDGMIEPSLGSCPKATHTSIVISIECSSLTLVSAMATFWVTPCCWSW